MPAMKDAPIDAARARPALLAALAALLLAGCASVTERWAEATIDDLSYPSLYNVVLTTIDSAGFTVRQRDPNVGRIESEWVYGTSRTVVRGPSRRKVFALIEPQPGGSFLVRVRVAEEVVRKGGMLATNPRAIEAWEEWEDNYDDAEYLLARVVALLGIRPETHLPPREPPAAHAP